jgi:hypothetical protein
MLLLSRVGYLFVEEEIGVQILLGALNLKVHTCKRLKN